MTNDPIAAAFLATCQDNIKCTTAYLCLMISVPYYGGPEEGGWWGADRLVVSYQEYPSEELAYAALERCESLVADYNKKARNEFGRRCLQETEWLDARGLDDSFLPEVDGESTYYLSVKETIPTNYYGNRHYS